MSSTLEDFNKLYSEFLNKLHEFYPSLKKEGSEEQTSDNTNLLHFMENIFPHMKAVSVCNEEWFKDEGDEVEVVKGVLLKDLIEDENTTSNQMNSIWEYLQTLYIRAQATDLTVELLKEKFVDHHAYNGIKKGIKRYHQYLPLITMFLESQKARDAEPSTEAEGKNGENPLGNMFEGTVLGDLAKEISEGLDTSGLENLNSGEDVMSAFTNPENSANMMNIMQNVMKKVDEKMKDGSFNPQELLGQLGSSLLGGAGGAGMGGMMEQVQNMMGMGNRKQRRKASKMGKKGRKGKK
jgi:hypothetical protein